ncbi:class I SAM-dependent methyltransferase [Mycobacteroides chelonae]|uniref:class I SAM-dependent methyltransferase n=1 Tax=Mycobacteroides chelonae TaxID=1774 RepID=UPI000AF007AF|nr:class I SAM-dependent methyltransferase [Mycobacteroides chelonae]
MTAGNPKDLIPDETPYFDDLAEMYESFTAVRDARTSPIRTWLVEHLPAGKRALDVGCGTGNNCVMLAEHYDCQWTAEIARRRT